MLTTREQAQHTRLLAKPVLAQEEREVLEYLHAKSCLKQRRRHDLPAPVESVLLKDQAI